MSTLYDTSKPRPKPAKPREQFNPLDAGQTRDPSKLKAAPPLKRCAAARDGDCTHAQCPQLRDNEPNATGRHCPLDTQDDDE